MALAEHSALLQLVTALSEDECTARGGCDTYADLWAALESGAPLVVLEAPSASRRARKQLLHRLSKQPAAAAYAWEALAAGSEAPTAEEGWARVLGPTEAE